MRHPIHVMVGRVRRPKRSLNFTFENFTGFKKKIIIIKIIIKLFNYITG